MGLGSLGERITWVTQLDLFTPIPCVCGKQPEVAFLPNAGPNGEWVIVGHFRCRENVYHPDLIQAIERWNEYDPTR